MSSIDTIHQIREIENEILYLLAELIGEQITYKRYRAKLTVLQSHRKELQALSIVQRTAENHQIRANMIEIQRILNL